MDGYYDSLLALIDSAVDEGFIKPPQRHLFVSAPNAKELVQKLEVRLFGPLLLTPLCVWRVRLSAHIVSICT